MLNDKEIIKVRNRDNGTVGYTIPDLGNLHRNFQSGEVKKVTMEELRKLSYIPGGEAILRDYLVIEDNNEAIAELLGEVELEYTYTEEDVEKLLKYGSLEEFLDCLDFAPQGVIELVKHLAVKFEVNDIAKRQAILEKTGFNVTNAIMINHETEKVGEEPVKTRRATTTVKDKQVTTTGATRRTTPKYNVTKIEK